MNVQFKKGVLELLVLSMIDKRDRYGYDVSDTLSQRIDIAAGTVYPILRKLKDEGFLKTYLSEVSAGPARKYYQITDKGRQKYRSLKEEWQQFIMLTDNILED